MSGLDKLLQEIKLSENPELLEQERQNAEIQKQAEQLQKILNEPMPDKDKQDKIFEKMQNISEEDAMNGLIMYFKELSGQWDSEEKNMYTDVINCLDPIFHKYSNKKIRGLIALSTFIGFYQSALEYPDILVYFDHTLPHVADGVNTFYNASSNPSVTISNSSSSSSKNNIEELD